MEELAVATTRALGFVTGLSYRSWLGLLVASAVAGVKVRIRIRAVAEVFAKASVGIVSVRGAHVGARRELEH